ncbi:thermonuclease family protein [Sphingomonas piscis]|uniref:Thermonuclease family protein n=1 Tax=Sphingomonas piscis TaxID=2714943 RepID=A0A6G7YPJ1_9SPHN|nr:thermonuclease family protein [Sphingomonas piscis]QIK78646.1 thermonuclease family protein [Sphingomonas piscis]
MKRHFALTITLFLTEPGFAQEIVSGVGKAADGDTLTLGADRIRLFGIDAPELNQTCERSGQRWNCGEEAKVRLASLISRGISCSTNGTDDFGRLLARCSLNGVDLNQLMVTSGFAVAFRRYSLDYVSAEEKARAAKRGIWAGSFQMPSDYRQSGRGGRPDKWVVTTNRVGPISRAAEEATSSSNSLRTACDIKGNRNRKGQWIYHMPEMPYYGSTRAEQMFCSEAEAQAAGYRRAIVR